MSQPALSSSVELIWSQYRIWAATARTLKKELTLWRMAAFILTITGSLAAILSQSLALENTDPVFKGLSWISASAIAIAGYAGSKILTSEKEKRWLQARAAAETCKSHAYLYLFKVAPYDDEAASDATLFYKIENLIRTLSTIPQANLANADSLKGIPPETYTFDNYLEERIHKQAKNYFAPNAERYKKYVKIGSWLGMALGALGFLLGSFGATTEGANTSVWIAFVSTVSASLTTFITANRYQYLSMSFQATANHLSILWLKGKRIPADDIDAQKEFINSCETSLAAENESWFAEFSKQETNELSETSNYSPLQQ